MGTAVPARLSYRAEGSTLQDVTKSPTPRNPARGVADGGMSNAQMELDRAHRRAADGEITIAEFRAIEKRCTQ